MKSKNADDVTQAINGVLEEWIPYIQTITADNGKEFAGHENVVEFFDRLLFCSSISLMGKRFK
ncbi:MAG: hypothetical protein HRT57_13435 [Crocinitomicaceae bacterium]|nr:hypothetical protein [Crocinitomicaceae bacterium]